MSSNNVGGFFVELGLNTNKDSFDKGFKSLDQMSNGVNRLVGTIRNAAPLITAGLAGSFETAELKTAKAIGISTRALDSWKVAASMAGTNANSLTQSMAQLESKMQGLKLGQIDQGLAQNLGHLGINYNDFADMNSEKRMTTVIKTAQAMTDQGKAAKLVGNILGSAGQDYYWYLQLSGKTLESQLAVGRSLTFTSEQSKRDAMEFNHELQAVYSAGKSMSMLFGSEIGKQLTPMVRGVREWIGANNELISQGIVGFVDDIGIVFNKLVGGIAKTAPLVKTLIDGFGGLDQVIIKVGIGIAALQVAKLASGFMSIFSSVSLIKMAFMGLAGGALAGGLIDIFKDPEKMDKLKDGMDKLSAAAKKLNEAMKPFMEKTFDMAINLFDDFANIISNLIDKDWDGLCENIKKFFTDFREGVSKILFGSGDDGKRNIENLGDKSAAAAAVIMNPEASTASKVGASVEATVATAALIAGAMTGILPKNEIDGYLDKHKPKGLFSRIDFNDLPEDMKKSLVEGFNSKELSATYYGGKIKNIPYDRKTGTYKINDGIISPGGHVTQVAPDDWVFATKNIGNLAAAFLPYGNNYNSSGSYVINQTFNVSGARDIGSTIKQQAYSGTQSALLQTISDSARRLQLMPGTF